jgi:hypothetical protein
MPDFPITHDQARRHAAMRTADALLRAMGAVNVTLRLPANIAVAGANLDLGLGTPAVEDVEIGPVVLRDLPPSRTGARAELLVSAASVADQVARRNFASADELFDAALGVVRDGRLLRIEDVSADSFADEPFLFRVVATE